MGECSHIEEKAVYINIIHDSLQWKIRKQSCSILKSQIPQFWVYTLFPVNQC